jgi:hypothetical protein
MDAVTLGQVQRLGLLRAGAARLKQQNPFFRHAARGQQVLVEPHTLADRVGHLPVLHEDARPAPCMHRAGLRQGGQRAAYGMPVHAETFGKLRLGRQAVARRVVPIGDLIGQVVADRGPERGSSQDVTKVSCGGLVRMHAFGL